ncbi:MAG TPA: TRAP transporter large permease subunit, partial [Tahibacter sp.]|nr:TRAP transporter large permease subunit [Tahibacter sp.]
MMSLSLVLLFLLFVVTGLPIAMAMGLSAAAVIWWFDMPLAVLAQRTINSLDSTPLLAVPMFI